MIEPTDEVLNKLRHNDPSLTSINLQHTISMGSLNLKDFIQVFKNNRTLKRLLLHFNDINDEGAKTLSTILIHNYTLTYLNLCANQITDLGATDLATVIRENKTLTDLNMSGNEIGDAGAREIASALKVNKTLLSLKVTLYGITNSGVNDIASALRENETLTEIHIDGSRISDIGINNLIQALQVNYTLITLDLDDYSVINVSDEYMKAIDDLISRNGRLMYRRRDQFIHVMLTLASDHINPKSISLWSWLPKDIKLYIISLIDFRGRLFIDKSPEQLFTCAKFIFSNITTIRAELKQSRMFKVCEHNGQPLNSSNKFTCTFYVDPEIILDELGYTEKLAKKFPRDRNRWSATQTAMMAAARNVADALSVYNDDDDSESMNDIANKVTYADVFLQKARIIELVTLCGYTEDVKLYYEPSENTDGKLNLIFIVNVASDHPSPSWNRYLLEIKLSRELGTKTKLIDLAGLSASECSLWYLKSALITDERAIRELIYRVNMGIREVVPIDDRELDSINLADFELNSSKVMTPYSGLFSKFLLNKPEKVIYESKTQPAKIVTGHRFK